MPTDKERIKILEVQVSETRKLLEILIDRYNANWHDVYNLPDYGYATFEPKQKFKIKR